MHAPPSTQLPPPQHSSCPSHSLQHAGQAHGGGWPALRRGCARDQRLRPLLFLRAPGGGGFTAQPQNLHGACCSQTIITQTLGGYLLTSPSTVCKSVQPPAPHPRAVHARTHLREATAHEPRVRLQRKPAQQRPGKRPAPSPSPSPQRHILDVYASLTRARVARMGSAKRNLHGND